MNIRHLLGVAAVMAASTVAHGAQTWTVNVPDSKTAKPQCADPNKADTCLFSTGHTNAFDDGATLTISCTDAAVCKDVRLFVAADSKPATEVKGGVDSADAKSRVYTLSTKDITAATNVGVFFQKDLLAPFTLQPNSGTPPPKQADTGAAATLESVVAASNPMPLLQCPSRLVASYSDPQDDGAAKANATMYVDVLGNVLAKPSRYSFDENDSLTVYVIGDKDLLQRLKVARTSDIRDVTILRNVGEGVQAPGLGQTQARGAESTCAMRKFDGIDSFAPGKGVVTISRVKGDDVATISTFDVEVAPLYSGMFTLGAARSNLVDPKYKLVANGSNQVIAPGDASGKDTLYSIFYTPFVWGKRDLEKPIVWSKWYRHINPTVGLVVDDVSNNFLAGVSVDLPQGVLVTFGRHYRRVTVLSKESGLSVGSTFTGTADTIPTAKSWQSDNFVAVSVDIRVMAQLVKNAFGAVASGK